MENTNFFESLYSELAADLQEKLANSQQTKNYYAKASCYLSNDYELTNISEEVIKKILLSLNTSNVAGIDQIPAKFRKESVEY